MTAPAAIFICSICGEPSTEICVTCTKDACGNHRCDRCKRCSDCCECDVPLSAAEAEVAAPPMEEPHFDAVPEIAPGHESPVSGQEPEPIEETAIQPPHENPIF